MTHLESIKNVPTIALVSPPTLSNETAKFIEAKHDELTRAPNRFDGDVLYCLSASRDEIKTYSTCYSSVVASVELDNRGASELGIGGLSVALVLTRNQHTLWSRRGPGLSYPGTWSFSAAGGVTPSESPLEAVLREAHEEIGLVQSDLADFGPLALVAKPGFPVVWIIFTARLTPGSTPVPDGCEVTEVAWARDPERELRHLTPIGVHSAWTALANAGLAAR